MKGEYKEFSKSLFQRNDPKSRQVVMEYFKRQKVALEPNQNKFGVDLIAKDGSMSVEVEHRNSWQSVEFPFDTVNVPERKAKYFVENNVHYAILSKDYTQIGLIDGKTLRKYIVDETLTECANKFVKQGEMFFKVPKNAFTWTQT
jgi:hypothetical protein